MSARAAKTQSAAREAPPTSDPELMTRLAAGEIGALGELYDRYQESIRRFVARATSDAEDVDDLVHATFLAAAHSAARYDGRAACSPWLIGIAAQLLRRRRHALGRFFAVMTSLRATRPTTADPRSALDAQSDIERALRQISEAKRITLHLAEVEGLSCPEIAAALGIPIGTVWTRLHAARRELRRMLNGGSEP
jgi:RNA polymerase sigma-70 factor (ECF subfamily)